MTYTYMKLLRCKIVMMICSFDWYLCYESLVSLAFFIIVHHLPLKLNYLFASAHKITGVWISWRPIPIVHSEHVVRIFDGDTVTRVSGRQHVFVRSSELYTSTHVISKWQMERNTRHVDFVVSGVGGSPPILTIRTHLKIKSIFISIHALLRYTYMSLSDAASVSPLSSMSAFSDDRCLS